MRVIGVGNRWRGDDAAGLEVARLLHARLPRGVGVVELDGEPIELIGAWEGADAIWVADAVLSGAEAGQVVRLDVHERELPPEFCRASTHHFGLAEAVELARSLGRLPARMVVYGVEGSCFDPGEELTPAVRAGVALAADRIHEEVAQCMSEP